MNVKELLRGIIVVVDDQIEEDASEISKILSTLKEDKFPVVTYEDVPDEEVIQSLSSASMVILDWEFKNRKTVGEMGNMTIDEISRIKIGELSNPIISFIKILLDKIFVPIFIFTNKTTSEIETALEQDNLKEQIGKRILIKQKNDLEGEKLYTEIENWFKNNPSAYAVKEWDIIAKKNRNDMFITLYESSSNWSKDIWNAVKEDSKKGVNTNYEFGDFITRNYVNRFISYNFEKEVLENGNSIDSENNIETVLKNDIIIEYKNLDDIKIPYTGDLYEYENNKFYLNIRAQCDINRNRNPKLYCISGEAKDINEYVIKEHVVFNNDGTFNIGNEKNLNPNEKNKYDEYNDMIKNCINKNVCYHFGCLIERNDTALLPYIKQGQIIEFKLKDIEIIKFNDYKDKRIGRIVSPYITRIQHKTANFITRQGLMPIPISYL